MALEMPENAIDGSSINDVIHKLKIEFNMHNIRRIYDASKNAQSILLGCGDCSEFKLQAC